MRLLLDTDAFVKLGCGGIVGDLAAALGTDLAGCRRLPALPYMLRRGRLAARLGCARCRDLLALVGQVRAAPAPDPLWLDRMSSIPSLDPGEVHLLAVAACAPKGVLLACGDKRAMAALPRVCGLCRALAGRLVTLEMATIMVCEAIGLDQLLTRMTNALDLDTTLAVCLRSGDALAGLRSYHRDLVASSQPSVFYVSHP